MKYIRWLLGSSIFVILIMSFYAIFQFLINPKALFINALSEQVKLLGRQTAIWEDPNEFGMILIFPLLFIISKVVIFDKFKNLPIDFVLGFIFIIIFFALLSTYSRSAWVSFFFSTIFIFLVTKNGLKIFYMLLTGIIILYILSYNDFFYVAIVKRITSLSITSTSNPSNYNRILLARAGLEMLFDSYFLGMGFMSFQTLFPTYINPNETLNVVASHNLSITLLAELGIFGFILYCTMFGAFVLLGIKILKRNKNISNEIRTYIVTFIAYLIALLIFYQFYPGGLHNNFIWICFGILLSLKKIAEKDKNFVVLK